MTEHYKYIYRNEPERYDRLVSREDQRGNLFAALMEIHPFDGARVVDFGAGTGRITRLYALLAQYVHAFDIEMSMLKVAQKSLEESGLTNWSIATADNGMMPLPDMCADIAVEGWSFGHSLAWMPADWKAQISRMIGEMERVLKPGGTAILLETMGTGNKQPQPPNDELARLYEWWETEHGFNYQWVRTDYQFESLEEADELLRFFFGDQLTDELLQKKQLIIPECTGIWWKKV